jgi:hypothetical protein
VAVADHGAVVQLGPAPRVVARGASGVEGYASFTFGSDPGGPLEFEYAINCRHLVAVSLEAWASLLSYLPWVPRPGADAEVHRPPGASAGVAGGRAAGATRVVVPVDAAAARRAGALWVAGIRRCPRSSSCRSRTGLFPENRGPWRVVAEGGAVSVEPASEAGGCGRSPSDALVALQRVPLGPGCGGVRARGRGGGAGVGSAVRGPAPWMYDFF